MSFGFRTIKDQWDTGQTLYIRMVKNPANG
ncbi:hypothetical protein [Xenorhabdus doucetiae]